MEEPLITSMNYVLSCALLLVFSGLKAKFSTIPFIFYIILLCNHT